jgi:hypothetical protein
LALGAGALCSLAFASSAGATVSPAPGTPLAGSNCTVTGTASTSGKISGRGATLPLYAVNTFMQDYSRDVCGVVPSGAANTYTPPAGTGEPTGDPTDPSSPVDANSGSSPQPTYNADFMTAYNYPAAQDHGGTGSGQGRTTLSCRLDAFGGSDIPYSIADFNKINGAPGAEATGGLLANCPPAATYVSPFQAGGAATDPVGHMMSYPVVGGAIAFAVNLPTACQNTAVGTTPYQFTTADINAIMSGNATTWAGLDPTNDPNLTAANGCNITPTRVVRQDNSGTTQNLFNYFGNPANTVDAAATLCNSPTNDTSSTPQPVPTHTWADMKNEILFTDVATNASWAGSKSDENNIWPSGGSCNNLAIGTGSGTPLLLRKLTTVSGGMGYGDVSDVVHDPGDAATLAIPQVQTSTGGFAAPTNTDGSANCSFASATLPAGGTPDNLMGINGEWALNAASNHTDVSFDHQGSAYPVCALTWELVFQGDDGNNKPAVSGNQGFLLQPTPLNPATPAAGTTTADIPVGTVSPATISVSATSTGLSTGEKLTVGGQAFTLTANAASGSTSLTGNFATSPTTVDIPSASAVVIPATIDPLNGAITSLPVAATTNQLFTNQVVTVGSGSNTQNFTLSANAVKGATSLSVTSQVPAFIMPAGSGVATSTLNLTAAPPAGTPTSGTMIVKATSLQAGSYSGVSGSTLTGVSGLFGSVAAASAALEVPNTAFPGNGPEPELNPNQRRTLFSYMSYVLSDAAQGTAPGAGYAQLPEGWINQLRTAFQADY